MTPVRSIWTTLTTSVREDSFFLLFKMCTEGSTASGLVSVGIGGVGILLLSSKNDEDDSGLDQSCARFDDDKVAVNGGTKAAGLCFLDDGLDWTGIRVSGEFIGETYTSGKVLKHSVNK